MIHTGSTSDDGNPKGTWAVYRVDDNGNTFLVRDCMTHQKEIRVVEEYEARGHKQTYWVEEMRRAENRH